MFSHVTVGSHDFARAVAFYDPVLATIGLKRVHSYAEHGWAGWMVADAPSVEGGPTFWVGRPANGQPPAPGNGCMTAFRAPTRKAVDEFHATALALGATDEGKPGIRMHYHPNYYGAYLRDLDGNKLCVVCHKSPEEGA